MPHGPWSWFGCVVCSSAVLCAALLVVRVARAYRPSLYLLWRTLHVRVSSAGRALHPSVSSSCAVDDVVSRTSHLARRMLLYMPRCAVVQGSQSVAAGASALDVCREQSLLPPGVPSSHREGAGPGAGPVVIIGPERTATSCESVMRGPGQGCRAPGGCPERSPGSCTAGSGSATATAVRQVQSRSHCQGPLAAGLRSLAGQFQGTRKQARAPGACSGSARVLSVREDLRPGDAATGSDAQARQASFPAGAAAGGCGCPSKPAACST